MEKVTVIGGGGREHAMAEALARSPHVDTVYVMPGNGGTVGGKFENVPLSKHKDIVDFNKDHEVALTVIGPEAPIVDGLSDALRLDRQRVFAPSSQAAQLEASKIFAKEFMKKNGIPTAHYETFSDAQAALSYVKDNHPVYVKADGLCGGKGAIKGATRRQAENAVRELMIDKAYGAAGGSVVIEDMLKGEEVSVMAFFNTRTGMIVPMPFSQDHKKRDEDDKGPNTGGMGAYAPTSLVTGTFAKMIYEDVLYRTMEGLQARGLDYVGFIYPGIMKTGFTPNVLEYNIRMGDPETQPILTLLESDFFEALDKAIDGTLKPDDLKWSPGYAVSVVAASGGYPGKVETGKEIKGLWEAERIEGVSVYHAGTRTDNGKTYTTGGRVLAVTGKDRAVQAAQERAYDAMDRIHFDGMFFRGDIAAREISR